MATTISPLLIPGSVVQTVFSSTGAMSTTTAVIPFDNSIPQNTEGTEILTVSITPKSATSILRVTGGLLWSITGSNGAGSALFKDSVVDAVWSGTSELGDNYMRGCPIGYSVIAGTTSAVTFKLRVGTQGAGTITINGRASTQYFGGTTATFLSVMEISA